MTKELTDNDAAKICKGVVETFVADFSIPQQYVNCYLTKAASRARHLLNYNYDLTMLVEIPAADVPDIANENMLQLINPTNNGKNADNFASSLGTMPELKKANGGFDVTVSADVQVHYVPKSVENLMPSLPTKRPTNSPTKSPTESPTKSLTKSPTPIALVLNSPQAIGVCDSLVLDGSSSSGASSLQYQWSCSNDAGLHEVLQKVRERRVVLLPDQFQKTNFSYR